MCDIAPGFHLKMCASFPFMPALLLGAYPDDCYCCWGQIVGRPHDAIVFSAATAQEEQHWIDK